MASSVFFFSLEFSSQGVSAELLGVLATQVLTHVGSSVEAVPELTAALRARGLDIVSAEDCFVHHFGEGAFSKLAPAEYNRLFEQNRRRYEKKWNVIWKPHQTRPGVVPPADDLHFQPETFCR